RGGPGVAAPTGAATGRRARPERYAVRTADASGAWGMAADPAPPVRDLCGRRFAYELPCEAGTALAYPPRLLRDRGPSRSRPGRVGAGRRAMSRRPRAPRSSGGPSLKLPSTLVLVLALAAVPPAIAQAPAPTAKPAAPPPAPSQRLDGIAAVVNNEAVLQSDVEEQLYLFLMRSQTQVDSATVDTLRTQVLNQLLDEKLILAEAQRLGITVSDAEVNRQAQEALADTKSPLQPA